MNYKQKFKLPTLSWELLRFKLIFFSVIIGLITGLAISLYRLLITKLTFFVSSIPKLNIWPPLLFISWLIIICLIGYLVQKLTLKSPLISGSGIPQISSELDNKTNMPWFKVLIHKFVSEILTISCGLSLGGPSIQVGGAIGKGISETCKQPHLKNHLISAGASAGMTAALFAPLSAVFFTIEQLNKKFNPLVFLSAMSAALSAGFVISLVFGNQPLIDFTSAQVLPIKYYLIAILIGIITGLAGVIYNTIILKSLKLYDKYINLPLSIKPLIPYILAAILLFSVPSVLGRGETLINDLIINQYSIGVLCSLLIIKFSFSIICYSAKIPGGIFFPLLSIGALIGLIISSSLDLVIPDNVYALNLALLAMSGLFTSVVRTPFTSIMLVLEMTQNFNMLFPVALTCLIAYFVSTICGNQPIYDSLLTRFRQANN